MEMMMRTLGPIKAKDFEEMKVEFNDLLFQARNFKQTDYQKQQDLVKGLRMVDDMLNVEAHTEDVLQYMSDSLMQRDNHFQYLKQLDEGLSDVLAVKKAY